MRVLFLSIFFALSIEVNADARFDSLFNESSVIVGGRIIRQEISACDEPGHQWICSVDIVIVNFGAARLIAADSLLKYYPGDTLRGITYYADSVNDVIGVADHLVAPMKLDGSKFTLTDQHSQNGIFFDHQLLYEHCDVFLDIWLPGTIYTVYASEKRSWRVYTSYNKYNRLVSVESHKQRSEHVAIHVTRDYDEEGKLTDRRRYRGIHHPGLYKLITWKFRENGRICLKRSFYATGRF